MTIRPIGAACLVALAGMAWFVLTPNPMVNTFVLHHALARQDLEGLGESLKRFAAEHQGLYPKDLGALADQDPRLENRLSDPWRRPYIYSASPDKRSFSLTCLGADGATDGEGDDADLKVTCSP